MWDFIASIWNCLFGSVCIVTSKVKEQFFHRLHYLTPFYLLWFKFPTMSFGLYPISRIVWYVQREHIGIPLFYFYWILEEQIRLGMHPSSFKVLNINQKHPSKKLLISRKNSNLKFYSHFLVSKMKNVWKSWNRYFVACLYWQHSVKIAIIYSSQFSTKILWNPHI